MTYDNTQLTAARNAWMASAITDADFMESVREARENGYDVVCIDCGAGMLDDTDIHESRCPRFVEGSNR